MNAKAAARLFIFCDAKATRQLKMLGCELSRIPSEKLTGKLEVVAMDIRNEDFDALPEYTRLSGIYQEMADREKRSMKERGVNPAKWEKKRHAELEWLRRQTRLTDKERVKIEARTKRWHLQRAEAALVESRDQVGPVRKEADLCFGVDWGARRGISDHNIWISGKSPAIPRADFQ